MCFSKRNEFRNNNSNKVRGHPTYIYKKVGNKYYFIGITHAKITHRVRNIKLEKNPNPQDTRPSYARPFSAEKKTDNFGKKKKGWKLSCTDRKTMNKIKQNYKK